jgi:putative peptide zinc metalloprotease protein
MFGLAEKPTTVPLLREELRLLPAANNADGSPAWMVQDPIVNKFYRIGWADFEILARWHLQEIKTIVDDVNQETTLNIDEDNVLGLAAFLQQHQLLRVSNAAEVSNIIFQANKAKPNILSWLVHHYLFFRIPLIKPQVLLAKCLPWVRWVFSPMAAFAVLMMTLTGLFLVTREWDTFSATFIDQLTLAGALSYGVALLFSKCLHELGHAFTATRYGVRVGHMGVAMLVMLPMPYTDTSESWKLTDNNKRLHIASAGIITELALAGIATLAWSLSPEGAIKSALFFLATTSWVLTLLVNASPFMRFDGYFILSDLLDFPNLHERSGALAKTSMRRLLLGFEEPWTEEFSTKKRRALIAFSTITWLYRLTVFIGIAFLVYYFFFKVLGIILFIIEILWFVLLPIWSEIKVWIARRAEIKPSRIIISLCLLSIIVALGFVPWQTSVNSSGWLHTTHQHVIYTPTAGKLSAMSQATHVRKGDSLFTLTSPDIALNALRAKGLADARATELLGLSGLEDGETKRAQIQLQQEQFNAEVKLYKDELSRMDLSAPFDGQLTDIDEQLSIGTWVHPKTPLAVLIDPNSWAVDAMVVESEIKRIKVGDIAKIYLLESHLNTLNGKVVSIDTAKINSLPHPLLDAQYGGEITTLPPSSAHDKSVPTQAYYKVRIAFDTPPKVNRMALVNVKIKTEARAWLPTFIDRIVALFVRESGF